MIGRRSRMPLSAAIAVSALGTAMCTCIAIVGSRRASSRIVSSTCLVAVLLGHLGLDPGGEGVGAGTGRAKAERRERLDQEVAHAAERRHRVGNRRLRGGLDLDDGRMGLERAEVQPVRDARQDLLAAEARGGQSRRSASALPRCRSSTATTCGSSGHSAQRGSSFTQAPGRPHHARDRLQRTLRRDVLPGSSSIASACHCTPTTKSRLGASIPSMTPSGDQATARRPRPSWSEA